MTKIKAAIVGYGNIGRYALEAVLAADDFELVGVVRRNVQNIPAELAGYTVVDDIEKLGKVDVALLCSPTRAIGDLAEKVLSQGINTVDSFDVHSDIVALKKRLDNVAKEHKSVAVVSAGWDPGSDSIMRTLMLAMAPKGVTYTNF
ncbi:Gfo/Idh/MocA family oxidoreductase, partial [Providencia stuartii]